MQEDIWELRKGDTLLGTLTLKEHDMFWFTCDFEATPAFEPLRELFVQESQLASAEDWEAWDKFVVSRIGELNLSLHINNYFADENRFMLHIFEKEASFRPLEPGIGGWVYKPFDNQK